MSTTLAKCLTAAEYSAALVLVYDFFKETSLKRHMDHKDSYIVEKVSLPLPRQHSNCLPYFVSRQFKAAAKSQSSGNRVKIL